MWVRGIRGATTVQANDADEILQATSELLDEIVQRNGVEPESIASVWITMTEDLNATFPARAIRTLPNWELVPIMCALEIPVEGSLPKCIRLMVHINTEKSQEAIQHVYLKDSAQLRPDLAEPAS
ncbi:chorismate mutase [Paenibacillus sp. SC116]|uniref:chorismate mutase n=1 Tax=Paenibacillus sp. SC116 TaxID=2968986 RepID=UPI00215AAF77|nr:chorismate mutase [Paenibacillus sp. SC116]MCR8842957.1 chorismate mutase [Paenibacillus sp. SC116]